MSTELWIRQAFPVKAEGLLLRETNKQLGKTFALICEDIKLAIVVAYLIFLLSVFSKFTLSSDSRHTWEGKYKLFSLYYLQYYFIHIFPVST